MLDQKVTTEPAAAKDHFTIGELQKIYGYGVDSLRYFERKGLLHPKRGENRYRYYSNDDYWMLNLTRNLRNAGLSVEQISTYLENRTLDSTMGILQSALEALEHNIEQLQNSAECIRKQIRTIAAINEALTDIVTVIRFPDRPIRVITGSYSTAEQFIALKYELLKEKAQGQYFSLIGDDLVGSLTSSQRIREEDYKTVDGVFMFDSDGTETLPAGNYLSIFYRGGPQNEVYIKKINDYARINGFEIEGPYLRLIRADNLATRDREEWAAELQVRIRE